MNIVIFQQVGVIIIQKVNTITNAFATFFMMFVKIAAIQKISYTQKPQINLWLLCFLFSIISSQVFRFFLQ